MKVTTGQQKSLEISTLYVETLHIEKILFVLSVPMLYKDIHMKIIMGHAFIQNLWRRNNSIHTRQM